jgi:hypothetical protein
LNRRTDYPLDFVHAPKGGPNGRRVGTRDRIIGVTVIAALLVGLRLFIRPEPFTTTVTEEHVLDSEQWSVSSALVDYTVFDQKSKPSSRMVLDANGKFYRKYDPTTTLFLSADGNNESMRSLAEEKETELLEIAEDINNVGSIEFSNVIVVCVYKTNCETYKKIIINSAMRLGTFEPLETPTK